MTKGILLQAERKGNILSISVRKISIIRLSIVYLLRRILIAFRNLSSSL